MALARGLHDAGRARVKSTPETANQAIFRAAPLGAATGSCVNPPVGHFAPVSIGSPVEVERKDPLDSLPALPAAVRIGTNWAQIDRVNGRFEFI